jgi:hypothetical protein
VAIGVRCVDGVVLRVLRSSSLLELSTTSPINAASLGLSGVDGFSGSISTSALSDGSETTKPDATNLPRKRARLRAADMF